MEPQVRLLGDRYELQSVLASGGMGRVWRARDTLLQRLGRGEDPAQRVHREPPPSSAASAPRPSTPPSSRTRTSPPSTTTASSHQDGEHLAYLVMELVEGESLATLLARERRLDVPQTLGILRATAAGLAAAHAAGVVHRDVKPGNVLLGPAGVVKITDFGIAWSASSVPLTQTGQVIGTAQYLSPEQATGGKAGPASDVYALGAVAYECLTGRRVFDGENSVQIAVKQIREDPDPLPAELPANVRRLVERALCKDPAERFPDGAALLAAVDDVLSGRPPVPPARTRTAVMPVPVAGGDRPAPGRAGVGDARGGPRAGRGAGGPGGARGRRPRGAGERADPGGRRDHRGGRRPRRRSPTVELAADDFVGRPVREVQAELVARGLQVSVVPVETADRARRAGAVRRAGRERWRPTRSSPSPTPSRRWRCRLPGRLPASRPSPRAPTARTAAPAARTAATGTATATATDGNGTTTRTATGTAGGTRTECPVAGTRSYGVTTDEVTVTGRKTSSGRGLVGRGTAERAGHRPSSAIASRSSPRRRPAVLLRPLGAAVRLPRGETGRVVIVSGRCRCAGPR